MPPSYQQIDPAETPARTTPASQTRRRIASSPCTRHTASRLATDPPLTQTTSWAIRCSSMSPRLGNGNRLRCVRSKPASRAASDMSCWKGRLSPLAVPMWQTLGTAEETPDSSTA